MPAFKCPRHGMRIAAHFCEHAESAVMSLQPLEVYIQKNEWGWCTVCPTCIGIPKASRDTDFLVCEGCVVDRALKTGSDYLTRCREPVEEFPSRDA